MFVVGLFYRSTYSKDYAAICSRDCEDCDEDCRKHEKHVECRASAGVLASIKLAYGLTQPGWSGKRKAGHWPALSFKEE